MLLNALKVGTAGDMRRSALRSNSVITFQHMVSGGHYEVLLSPPALQAISSASILA